MKLEVVQELVKLADLLDKRGMRKEADAVDRLIVQAGLMDSLKSFIDAAKTAAIKKTVEGLKSFVNKDPEKVAKYLISITAWLAKISNVIKQMQSKKASLSVMSRDWLSTLRDVALIAAAVVSIVHGLENNQKLSDHTKQDLLKTKEIATSVTHEFELGGFQMAFTHDTTETRTERTH